MRTCGDPGFHHGILSGIGLVCSLDLISRHAFGRAAVIAAALNVPAGTSLLGLPATLCELGYKAKKVELLGAAVHASPFNLRARHHPTAEVLAEMLRRSSDGKVGE